MAEAINYGYQPRSENNEFNHDLHDAPEEHAEATLDAFAILQLLRDKGVLEMIKDALGSMEKVMEVITQVLEREEVVRTIRNATILIKILGSIEPATLENIMKSLATATEASKKPPGLLHLLGQLTSSDTRRALEPIAAILQAAGRSITQAPKEERTHTTRHSA